MRFADAVCYILLTFTISSSCARMERQNEVGESLPDKRMRKRDATILTSGNYAFERIFQKPKMVYRRLAQQRFVPPKSKYGAPKPKYGPKPRRSPPKKFRPKPELPKRGVVPNHKNRPKKHSRHGAPQKPNHKPVYRPPKKAPSYAYFSPSPSGFGEPPVYDYRPPRHTYAEPPIDSYGEPIKPVYEDPTAPSFPTDTGYLANQDFNYRQEYKPWMNFVPGQKTRQKPRYADTGYEHSKKVPVVTKPEAPIYVTPAPVDDYEDVNVETEASVPKQSYYDKNKKKRLLSNSKLVRKPWRMPRKPEADEEIIVGGRYAEPPGRFAQRYPPSAPMYDDDEEISSREPYDAAPSASNSPYVNYKNSNMAFSPQNLNDAFSISK